MNSFYNLLQFTDLIELESIPQNSIYFEKLKDLNIEKIHFSGKFPTVFFKEVKQFDNKTLIEIVKIHHKLWNYKKVMFLYVTSLTEIRIYNCTSKPFDYTLEPSNIENIISEYELVRSDIHDKKKLNELLKVFSLSAIDSGSIWNRPNNYIKKINLKKRIDNFLVTSLVALANKLEEDGLELDVIHSLIMRSLFILYLEDKGATPLELYKNNNCYFNLLDDKDATYLFFEKIQENFNGNVFPVSIQEIKQVDEKHLKLLKQCFINGDVNDTSLFKDWRIFKFDIIDIELLSQIYENFLSQIEKVESGSYYTPPELVELMLNEVLPIENETNYEIKVLDPTCGSGIFLVESYKRIVQRWQNKYPDKSIDFKTLKYLMTNSIYGVELNPRSIKVATFSLYLALLDFLYPKTLWYQGKEKFPYLINDKENNVNKQGYNLFRTDVIEDNKEFEKKYDVIVGNPPYGKKVPPNIKAYCNSRDFAIEFVIPFIHKSTVLSPNGKIALLMPTKLLTNTKRTSQNFRKWLFNDNYVEKIYNLSILRNVPSNYGGQLFSSAIVPASIIFFQNKIPKEQIKTIGYWAPKSYIKSHIAEGVIIDSSDVKYLPRVECQKPDTKIWKIAQWGTLNDFFLINNLNNLNNLNTYIDKKDFGGGFQKKINGALNLDIKELPFIDTKELNLYYTKKDKTELIDDISFERLGTLDAYKSPHILIKEGIKKVTINNRSDYRIVSSFLDYDCSFSKGVIGIHHKNKKLLKSLSSYFNSTFMKYIMFLTSSSWGIERDVIKSNEFLIPDFLKENEIIEILSKYHDDINQLVENTYPLINDILSIENKIDEEIFKFLNFSKNEKIFIDNIMQVSVDLFYNGMKSTSIKSLDNDIPETIAYSKKLCEELNITIEESEFKVISYVYKNIYNMPLCLVVLKFIDRKSEKIESLNIIESDNEFKKILSRLNKHTLSEYSKGIYIQKNLTYYDEDNIYIIKPNQKRFWSLSSAIEDAQNITLEVMGMPE